jgi:hypothetical protein
MGAVADVAAVDDVDVDTATATVGLLSMRAARRASGGERMSHNSLPTSGTIALPLRVIDVDRDGAVSLRALVTLALNAP